MYKCEMCGFTFEKPYINQGYEPMPDCFYERFKDVICPYCGSPYFNEIEDE